MGQKRTDLLRGTLDLLVLKALSWSPYMESESLDVSRKSLKALIR